MNFADRILSACEAKESRLVVGLDPHWDLIPQAMREEAAHPAEAVARFILAAVDATIDHAAAYKPQIAFFEQFGTPGMAALDQVLARIHALGGLVIMDAKRGDIGSTAENYAREAYERYGAHALTVSPYMGLDSIEPYLAWKDRGVIVLCRTSNPGGSDLQFLKLDNGEPLYLHVAGLVADKWNAGGQCGLVVGATFPNELASVRQRIGDAVPLLVPGIGAQGGDITATVNAGRNAAGTGMMINSSRAILYASGGDDWRDAAAKAARDLRDAVNAVR